MVNWSTIIIWGNPNLKQTQLESIRSIYDNGVPSLFIHQVVGKGHWGRLWQQHSASVPAKESSSDGILMRRGVSGIKFICKACPRPTDVGIKIECLVSGESWVLWVGRHDRKRHAQSTLNESDLESVDRTIAITWLVCWTTHTEKEWKTSVSSRMNKWVCISSLSISNLLQKNIIVIISFLLY
jgi:hypothetical protein